MKKFRKNRVCTGITIFTGIALLIIGGLDYSEVIERIEGMDGGRRTPAYRMGDMVDYIQLPWWKVFLIQFSNMAGAVAVVAAILVVWNYMRRNEDVVSAP